MTACWRLVVCPAMKLKTGIILNDTTIKLTKYKRSSAKNYIDSEEVFNFKYLKIKPDSTNNYIK